MNVLIVSGIFPPDIGGPATYVYHTAKRLQEIGHEVTVVTLADKIAPSAEDLGFNIARISRSMPVALRIPRVFVEVVRKGLGADVIFTSGLALEAVMANLLLQKPLVQKVVGDFAWERARHRRWTTEDFEGFQRIEATKRIQLLKRLRRWWIQRSDFIIVPSQYLRRWAQTMGVADSQIFVIANAVTNGGSTALPKSIRLPGRKNLVTVGRLVSYKGIDGILDLLPLLPDVGLLIVGDGPERNPLEIKSRDLDIADRVLFTGVLPHNEVISVFDSCDAFVLNSEHEGLPHVVLEAMAAGVPVVATDVGGTGEIISHGFNGLLVGQGDPDAMLNALERVLGDDELSRKLAMQGQETVAARFTLDEMDSSTESVLLLAAEGTGR